ncbi:uncharacterized protein BO72DRAFT_410546 [Aspergillus fijiensis CBS 313.89]|uniref:Aminoglycoside phosphotransferase domain-containing protein n=1 Tax=Aspergillus fijiensis CBS 313.89 TaxID=1448319 RepID=A0A8G1RLE4_9EURO|nr:uncharacterized protein BO72DRAFT_410546 [Aspergillus fijiensis CBS 313.89]RAK74288.1 hypothetical protein BO72DRAFT_410546 [Aspergillus fijiensis CBS 313.89]
METDASPSKDELRALLQQAREAATKEKERAEQEKERAEKVEKQNQNTTFAEYLHACHDFITVPMTIQTNRSLTTKGSITDPTGRICPTFLRPFDFRKAQQDVFDELYKSFHSPSDLRLFPSRPIIEYTGKQACRYPLASEADLAQYKKAELENPVMEIFDKLLQLPEDRRPFLLDEGIIFENHSNTVTENPDQMTPARPPTSKEQMKPARPPADRHCVYQKSGDTRSLAYIIEYKAAHKLTDAFLRAGLRPMNLVEEVVQRVTIPTDLDEKLCYDAAFLSCAAVTQTYEYMMKSGLEYGLLTNGHMKVILRIPENNPDALEYDLLEPSRDAEAKPTDGCGFRFPYTAIGYQLSLTLMAIRSPQRSQAWRNEIIAASSRCEIDFERALRSIPESERKTSPPGSEYREPIYPINNRSPYLLRLRVRGDSRPVQPYRSPSPDSSGESDSGQKHPLSSPTQDRGKRQRTSNASHQSHRVPGQTSKYNFCTQLCLRGLVHQSELDDKCPNVDLHRRKSDDRRHTISRDTLIKLVEQQLNADLDSCTPLGKEGVHGSIFAIQLQSHGYAMIGKGTDHHSDRESIMYRKLESLQRFAVPIYLGDVYLQSTYYTDSGREIIHLSLMAWGGRALQESDRPRLQHYMNDTEAEVREAGVLHLDLHMSNFLWNEEAARVMLIDFSRAEISRKRKGSVDLSAKQHRKQRLFTDHVHTVPRYAC